MQGSKVQTKIQKYCQSKILKRKQDGGQYASKPK